VAMELPRGRATATATGQSVVLEVFYHIGPFPHELFDHDCSRPGLGRAALNCVLAQWVTVETGSARRRRHLLLAHDHETSLARQVYEGLTADIDRHSVDGPSAEGEGRFTRVVIGDRFARVTPHIQAGAGDGQSAELGLDLGPTHLVVPVVERQLPAAWSGSMLVLSKEAESTTCLPVGTSSDPTTLCSVPTKLLT
jgi:hypothetical protein